MNQKILPIILIGGGSTILFVGSSIVSAIRQNKFNRCVLEFMNAQTKYNKIDCALDDDNHAEMKFMFSETEKLHKEVEELQSQINDLKSNNSKEESKIEK